MSENGTNSKRIIKNTFVLYLRMLFLMVIGLYTSRVVLQLLGVDDFGIYNVVGGFVALFAVLSQSLSSAASRFLTFELGKRNFNKLSAVFSTTLIIHFVLALVIAVLAESVGVWFVNCRMVIPPERVVAANWAFQFSVLTFCVTLVTVPYQAAVIAHENMKAFAYISVFDGIGKLLICYLLTNSPTDRLIYYAFMMFVVQSVSRGLFYVYCRRNYAECKALWTCDRVLLKDIAGFAGWNMIGSTSAILRNQGVNVLLNLFYGPVVNAARALANQVMQVVNNFVENYFMAIRPQITKSYANGARDYMTTLIFYGCRLSYYMLLMICLPILMSTDYLLHFWLTMVPEKSVLFVQLSLIFTMIESISSPLVTAQLATGRIRNYQIVVGGLQMMNLPVSYVFLKFNASPEIVYYVAISIAVCCLFARLFMLRNGIHLNVPDFIRCILFNAFSVTFISVALSLFVSKFFNGTFISFVVCSFLYIIISLLTIMYVGCKSQERAFVLAKAKKYIRRKCDD